jgi:L-malate glycosyltransferase
MRAAAAGISMPPKTAGCERELLPITMLTMSRGRAALPSHAGRTGCPQVGLAAAPAPMHVLHVFPSFGIGGVPLRMARVINHFGTRLRHTIIALDHDFAAAGGLAENLDLRLIDIGRVRRSVVRSVLSGAAALHRLRPNLLATYNWGAIEWAIANRLLAGTPHLHFEAGFGPQETDRQIPRRVLLRRWALARCVKVAVPSQHLVRLASNVWRLPPERIAFVPNGVDLERFAAPPRDAIPGLMLRPGESVIGTLAPLRPEKNVGRLLRVFAALGKGPKTRLVIAGEGSEAPKLTRLAAELGIADRVVFTGGVAPETVLGSFDVFALSSDTEQMPNALLEAMAASRAVAAVDVGDVKSMLSNENREFVVPRDDAAAFAAAIAALLRDPGKRDELGRRNRERAAAAFSQEQMFKAYARLFALVGQG